MKRIIFVISIVLLAILAGCIGEDSELESGITYEEYRQFNPPPLQNIQATAQDDGILVTWEASQPVSSPHQYEDEALFYRIFLGIENTVGVVFLGETEEMSYLYKDTKEGTTYHFSISAVHANKFGGQNEGSRSNPASAVATVTAEKFQERATQIFKGVLDEADYDDEAEYEYECYEGRFLTMEDDTKYLLIGDVDQLYLFNDPDMDTYGIDIEVNGIPIGPLCEGTSCECLLSIRVVSITYPEEFPPVFNDSGEVVGSQGTTDWE